MLRKPLVYIQLSPERVTVRDVRTGESLTSSPDIAIARGKRPRVVAVGAKARKQESRTVQVLNPFVHPRSLLADFGAGTLLLRTLLAQRPGRSMFRPRVVLHLQHDPIGGFTQLELRGFHELALGAGAAEVLLWHGPNLTDEQVRGAQFPKEGRVLSS